MTVTLLIDGHSLAYRAFYAVPQSLSSLTGQPTNVIHGFLKMLMKIVRTVSPHRLGIAFDTKTPSFRHQIYPEYKSHRPPSPPSFYTQIPLLQDLLQKMGVCVVTHDGVEADDILATLAYRAQEWGDVLIITGDKDMLQCVTPCVSICMPHKGLSTMKTYHSKNFYEETKLRPDQIVDYKCLIGDTSDHIIGIQGIGEKTAIDLLTTYDSLDSLWEHRLELPEKIKHKIIASETQLSLNKKLITLLQDVPIHIKKENLMFTGLHIHQVEHQLTDLNLRSFLLSATRSSDHPDSEKKPSLSLSKECPSEQSGAKELRPVYLHPPEQLSLF